jgi:hypothetical protein
MSYVSDVREICGDYAIDIKYHEGQKEAITLYFNSRRNAETVKRCIEVDDSVPNVATAVDFVEVVRCKDCKHYKGEQFNCWLMRTKMQPTDYCSYGERSENGT